MGKGAGVTGGSGLAHPAPREGEREAAPCSPAAVYESRACPMPSLVPATPGGQRRLPQPPNCQGLRCQRAENKAGSFCPGHME